MADGGQITIKAILETGDFNRKLNDMRSGLRDVGDPAQNLSKNLDSVEASSQKASDGFTVAKGALSGLVAGGVTVAVGALGNLASKAVEVGKEFSSSMSNVSALSGATGEDLAQLESLAREMGATTTFSASQAADALGYMALAGWDTTEMTAGLAPVLQLAQAGSMDLAAASDLCTDYLSAFSMGAEDTQRMVDVLAYAQGNANTTTEGLGMAFKNCAANCNAAGMDVETTTAAISMLANQGLKGSEAGTALTAVMRDMTAKMEDGAIMIGDTSVAVMDANGNYRDFADILADVEAATDGMGEAERASALMTTFTADSIKGLNLMLNAGSEELVNFREELYNSAGAAETMANTMTDNLEGDVKAMQSAFEEFCLKLYDNFEQPMREAVQFVTSDVVPALEDFSKFVSDNLDSIITIAEGIAGFAVAKTVAPEIRKLAVNLKDMATKGTLASSAMGKFISVAGGLVGVVAAIAISQLVNDFMDYRDWCDTCSDATDSLNDAIEAMDASGIEDLGDSFENAGEKASKSVDDVRDSLKDAMRDTADFGDEVKEKFDNFSLDQSRLDNAIAKIEELGSKGSLTASEQAELNAAVETYNEITGESVTVTNQQTGELDTSTKALEENAKAWETLTRQEMLTETLKGLYSELAKYEQEVGDAHQALVDRFGKNWAKAYDDIMAGRKENVDADLLIDQEAFLSAVDTLHAAEEQYKNTNKAIENTTQKLEVNSEAFNENTEGAEETATAQGEAGDAAEETGTKIEEAADKSYSYIDAQGVLVTVSEEAVEAFEDMCEELDKLAASNELFKQALDASGYSVPDFAAALQTAGIDVGTFEDRMNSLADTTQDAFSRMEQQETISLDEMIANMQANQEAVNNWRENLITLYAMAGDDVRASGFVESLAEMGPEYADQLQLIIDGGQEKFNELAAAFGDGANVAMSAAAESFDLGGGTILEGVNLTFSQLANYMNDMGLNISDFGKIGADEFAALAENFGLSMSDLAAVADSLQIEIDQPIRDAAASASSAAEDMNDDLAAKLEAAKDDIPAIYSDAAKQAAVEYAEAGVDIVSTSGQIIEDVKAATDPIKESYPAIHREALTGANKEIESGGETAVQTSSVVRDEIKGAMEPLAEELPRPFGTAFGTINENIATDGAKAVQTVTDTTTGIQNKVSELETSVPKSGQVSMEGFSKAIDAGKDQAKGSSEMVSKYALSPLTDLASKAQTAGSNDGSMFASGLSSQSGPAQTAGTSVSSSGGTGLQTYNGSSYGWGLELGGNFAAGIRDSAPQVSYAAQAAADAAAAMLKHSIPKKGVLNNGGKGEKQWGEHLIQNFSSGLNSNLSLKRMSEASNSVAQVVVDYLGHTSPKKGALKGGEWVYGYHAALNMAQGLESGSKNVKDAASNMSDMVAAEFSRMASSYKKNIDEIKGLSTDLSVYLNEMANSAGKAKLTAPVYAGTTAFKQMDAIAKAGYETVADFKAASKEFVETDKEWKEKLVQHEDDYAEKKKKAQDKYNKAIESGNKKLESATDTWNKKQAKLTEANTAWWEAYWAVQNNTDAKKAESLQKKLDTADKNWYKAEANLKEESAKWYKTEAEVKAAEKKAADELKKTQAELKADYEKSGAQLREEHKAFLEEYDAYNKLAASITVPLDKLEKSESLYHVTSDITSAIGGSTGLTETLKKLGTKGVKYTQAFVDAMVEGGDEYIEALGDMSDMTDAEVQSFVDSFESMAIAEREAALAARELYIDSAKTASGAESDREKWLSFRETMADVKESLNGNAGLAQAFRHAGTSVEGLAADLQSLNVDMEALAAKAEDWSNTVSNGFNALSTVDKTGATDFVNNLKNNMAQTQLYTENVQTVFGKIADVPAEATEAFRKAVLEGGYDQFAGVMSDMAGMTEEQIMAIINTYNDSVQQGLQDSISQFQALAPGEELMIATIEGMEAQREELLTSMQETAKLAAEAGVELSPEFESVGTELMNHLESGVLSRAQAIANAAASVVSQAIQAAKAAAGAGMEGATTIFSTKASAGVAAKSVNWYASGAVFDKASIIGVGEAGREAVVPLTGARMQPFAEAIASQMGGSSSETVVNINIGTFENKSDKDLDEIVNYVNRRIASKAKTETKSKGKTWA